MHSEIPHQMDCLPALGLALKYSNRGHSATHGNSDYKRGTPDESENPVLVRQLKYLDLSVVWRSRSEPWIRPDQAPSVSIRIHSFA